MSLFLELHLLQNFVPSNLNRDDTGAPKDCEFGGYRRARISSQCLKRAVRQAFTKDSLLPPEVLSARTRRIHAELVGRLVTDGLAQDDSERVVAAALNAAGFQLDDKDHTQYLLFLSHGEIEALAHLCRGHWDALLTAAAPTDQNATGKGSKKAAKVPVDPKLGAAMKGALRTSHAVDLALFGRMVADDKELGVDAATQVAHAISTHQVSPEFDFYTAVDDLNLAGDTGAGMMGTIEFNSACYYRYASIDVDQFRDNLEGDAELVRAGVQAFLRASVTAVPSGKKNSMAQQNPPSLVLTVVRERGQWSLANAFAKPVRPGRSGDLVAESAQALDAYWGELTAMYGTMGIRRATVATLGDLGLGKLAEARVGSLDELVATTVGAL